MIFKSIFAHALIGIALFSIPAFSKEDSRVFLQKAAQAEIGEINQAELALKKSSNPDVKALAKAMVEAQKRANKQVKLLAEKKRVGLPDEITPKQEAVLYRLSRLSDRDHSFDLKYLNQVIKDREEGVRIFRKQAKTGTDEEVRTFAAKTLPQIRSHLESAKGIRLKLENPQSVQDPSNTISSSGLR